MVAATFIVFLLVFVGIGVYSATRKQDTADDYLLASRSVSPWFTALSAVATNNSGFMFMGLIGATYIEGIRAMWLMVGWVIGDWMAWFVVHERLRRLSEKQSVSTIPGFLASGLKHGRIIAAVAGFITLLFLGLYAAAQLKAGSKALHHIFDWDMQVGAIVGSVIVAAYCFAGGIRASIWTDAAQSFVMIVSMTLLFAVALAKTGGISELWSLLGAIDPDGEGPKQAGSLTAIFPSGYVFGFFGYMLGWMGAGAGVVGQPHVMIRAMALDSPDNMAKARRIYIVWYVLFSIACIGVGLAARVLVPSALGDPEMALPVLSSQLLPAALIGLILAGLFSATISTADSQILACSAALSHDLLPGEPTYIRVKMTTLVVACISLAFALFGPPSVFTIVTMAWAGLAAGLGPLMVVRARQWPIDAALALMMMIGGVAGALVWLYVLQLSDSVYQALPGMLAGFAIYGIGRAAGLGKGANRNAG